MANQPAAPSAPTAQQLQQQNAYNRQLVIQNSVDMLQSVAVGTVFPASQPVLNLQPRYVGLIKRFYLEVKATIMNSGTTTVTLTDFGLANLLSNMIYTDPANNQRHNTLGLHLAMLSSAKRKRPFGASIQSNTANGNNNSQGVNAPPASWPVFVAPQTIASGASATVTMFYEIPLAYSDEDLRGAVYSNLVNATQNLQLTFNAAPITANPADNTYAVYSGAAGSAGAITSLTYNLYQNYLDQIPTNPSTGRPILPGIDLSTIYQLKNTNFNSITANQWTYFSYSNFNSFVSTYAIFNSTGTNAGRLYGTDVTFWALTAANLTNLWQFDPTLAALLSRNHQMIDLPAGTYYFPSRRDPILTNQFGNIQLGLQAASSNASATVQVLWEYFASLNTASSGGSLAVA